MLVLVVDGQTSVDCDEVGVCLLIYGRLKWYIKEEKTHPTGYKGEAGPMRWMGYIHKKFILQYVNCGQEVTILTRFFNLSTVCLIPTV